MNPLAQKVIRNVRAYRRRGKHGVVAVGAHTERYPVAEKKPKLARPKQFAKPAEKPAKRSPISAFPDITPPETKFMWSGFDQTAAQQGEVDRFHFRAITFESGSAAKRAKDATALKADSEKTLTNVGHVFSELAKAIGLSDAELSWRSRLAVVIEGFVLDPNVGGEYFPGQVSLAVREGHNASLAHEWGHFLDHMVRYVTLPEKIIRRSQPASDKVVRETNKFFSEAGPPAGVKGPVQEAMEVVLDLIDSEPYPGEDGKKVGSMRVHGNRWDRKQYGFDREGEYWARPAEMFARAFESYVGRKNKTFRDKRHKTWELFPQGAAQKKIDAAFDNLFAVMRGEHFFEKAVLVLRNVRGYQRKQGGRVVTVRPHTERYAAAEKKPAAEKPKAEKKPASASTRKFAPFKFYKIDLDGWPTLPNGPRAIGDVRQGLADLAEVMGVPPSFLAWNQRLSLKFAEGLDFTWNGMYIPADLTLLIQPWAAEGGTLAHEWGHFLDHVLARTLYPKMGDESYATEVIQMKAEMLGTNAYGPDGSIRINLDMTGKRDQVHPDARKDVRRVARGPLDKAMADVFHLIKTETYQSRIKPDPKGGWTWRSMEQWSKIKGKGTREGTAYWAKPTEMFARAFESYISDKLEAAGKKDSPAVDFNGDDHYPQGVARQKINDAFDRLIAEVKQSQVFEKSMMLFLKGDTEKSMAVRMVPAYNRKVNGKIVHVPAHAQHYRHSDRLSPAPGSGGGKGALPPAKDYHQGDEVDWFAPFHLREVDVDGWPAKVSGRKGIAEVRQSFQDLSRVMGVAENVVSLNGRLALEFMGDPDTGDWAGRYKSDDRVLQIQPLGIHGGTIAHEWFHFVDNMLVALFDPKEESKGNFLSEHLIYPDPANAPRTPPGLKKALQDLLDLAVGAPYPGALQTPFGPIPHTLAMVGWGNMVDAGTGMNYWANPTEILARAFETYVEEKLKTNGLTHSPLIGKDYGQPIYPQEPARAEFAAAFDNLFEELKKDHFFEKSLAYVEKAFASPRFEEGSFLHPEKGEMHVPAGVEHSAFLQQKGELHPHESPEQWQNRTGAVRYRKVRNRSASAIYVVPSNPRSMKMAQRHWEKNHLPNNEIAHVYVLNKKDPDETEGDFEPYLDSDNWQKDYHESRMLKGNVRGYVRMVGGKQQLVNPYGRKDRARRLLPPGAERRRVSFELAFGDGSPYAEEFPSLYDLPYQESAAITRQVLGKIVRAVLGETGAKRIHLFYGPGGYQDYPASPSAQMDVGAKDTGAIQDTIAAIGYLAQQTEVYASKPNPAGQTLALDIVERGTQKLARPEVVHQFFTRLGQLAPRLFQGYAPVRVGGKVGIRILNADTSDGPWREDEFAGFMAAAEKAASEIGIRLDPQWTKGLRVDFESTKNDWTEHPQGEALLGAIRQRGRSALSGRLVNRYRPLVHEWIRGAFLRNARREYTAWLAARGGAGGTAVPAGNGQPEGAGEPALVLKSLPVIDLPRAALAELFTLSPERARGFLKAHPRRGFWRKLPITERMVWVDPTWVKEQMHQERFPAEAQNPSKQGTITAKWAGRGLQRFMHQLYGEAPEGHWDPELERAERPAGMSPKDWVELRARWASGLAVPEVLWQLKQENSGSEWYQHDIEKTKETLRNIYPEMKEKPWLLDVFMTVTSVTSTLMEPNVNLMQAARNYEYWRSLGFDKPVPPKQPGGPGESSYWGIFPNSAHAISNLNKIIALHGGGDAGIQGAIQWLKEKHPVAELHKYSKSVRGKATDLEYGSMIFGPKLGAFWQNVVAGNMEALTVDRWVTRTWGRWMGQIFEFNKKGVQNPLGGWVPRDAPRGQERQMIRRAMEMTRDRLCQEFGKCLDLAGLQAALWYYEQALWRGVGAYMESWSYSDGARQLAEAKGPDLRPVPAGVNNKKDKGAGSAAVTRATLRRAALDKRAAAAGAGTTALVRYQPQETRLVLRGA